jgi:hypothetical protein
LAVLGAVDTARSEIFDPAINKEISDLQDSIKELEQRRNEIQNILSVWEPTQAAALLTQVLKLTTDLIIDLCRIGCPGGDTEIVFQFRDKVQDYLKKQKLINEDEAYPESLKKAEEILIKVFPDKQVKNLAKTTHNFANNIKTSIKMVEDAGYDKDLRKTIVILDKQIGKFRTKLLLLKSKLEKIQLEKKGFPNEYAKKLKKAFKQDAYHITCLEDQSQGTGTVDCATFRNQVNQVENDFKIAVDKQEQCEALAKDTINYDSHLCWENSSSTSPLPVTEYDTCITQAKFKYLSAQNLCIDDYELAEQNMQNMLNKLNQLCGNSGGFLP